MNNVIWLSIKEGTPARGMWDQNLFELAFEGYNHSEKITDQEEAIVIVPGAYQDVDKINREITKLTKCVVIITSDEENKFEINRLDHPEMKVFTTYPNQPPSEYYNWLPIWYPPHANNVSPLEKTIDWLFLGQINHQKRKEMRDEVYSIPKGMIYDTGGFSRGLERSEYLSLMSRSKVVLCPRGNVSLDSFRIYEALECGSIPIAEGRTFWTNMFGECQFPVVDNRSEWNTHLRNSIEIYDHLSPKISEWWKQTKKDTFEKLRNL